MLAATVIALLPAFTAITVMSWKVRSDYSVKTTIGSFKGLKANIQFDEEHPERSTIKAFIDAASVNTGNGMMDEHAREKTALYTDLYRVISFVSTSVKRTGKTGQYEATGNLTIKGVTRQIKIPFVFDSKKDHNDLFPFTPKLTFRGSFGIVPKDYNITRPGTPEWLTVDLEIPVTK